MPISTIKIPGGKELIDAKEVLEKVGIEEKMKVADLGCGYRGYFTLQAAKLVGARGLVYAVDVLKSALESVKSLASLYGVDNIHALWADLEVAGSVKIEDGSIDLAMLNNIFFQTKKADIVLREAARILKKDGKLLVTIWKKAGAPFGPPVEARTTPEEVKENARNAGLTLEKEFESGPYHFSLVFVKK